MKFNIVIAQINDRLFMASCTNLEGCHVEAEGEAEARELIKAAIEAYIVSCKKRYEQIPYKAESISG